MKNLIIPEQLLLKAKSLIANRQDDDIDLTHAIVLIDMALQEMSWTSVEDGLPKAMGIIVQYNVVVVYDNRRYSHCAWWDGEQFRSPLFAGNIHEYITHWKSLPEPPESEE